MEIAKTIYSAMNTEYDPVCVPDVVFARRESGDLTLQLMLPVDPGILPPVDYYDPIGPKMEEWASRGAKPLHVPAPEDAKFPLIVCCPGSGWAGADGHQYMARLVSLARRGFASAAVSYRGTYRDDVVFPAAVQDLREAVRFLRANAPQFRIDPDRVGLLGDSSGGNTAAIAALAGSEVPGFPELRFDAGEYPEVSSDVKAVCLVYAPVDLLNMLDDRVREGKLLRPGEEESGLPFERMEIWQDRYRDDPERYLAAASPISYVGDAAHLPPVLFVQGDEDQIIPMAQGLRFCEKLRERGGRAEFVKVAGGDHGGGIWSREMLDLTAQFFKAYL